MNGLPCASPATSGVLRMGLIMIIVTDDGNLDPTRRDLAERARHGIQQIARRADDGQTGGTSWGYDRYSTHFRFTAVKWLTAEAIMDARPMVRAPRPPPRPGPEIGRAPAPADRTLRRASPQSAILRTEPQACDAVSTKWCARLSISGRTSPQRHRRETVS